MGTIEARSTRPVIPRTLRRALAQQRLPAWLCEEAGLSGEATLGDLCPELLDGRTDALRRRVQLFVTRLLDHRRAALRRVPIADRPWPPAVDACLLDCGEPIRRRLVDAGITDEQLILARATYGDLFARPRLGARTIYEVAVAVEQLLDRAYASFELPQELLELAHDAASPAACAGIQRIDESSLEVALRGYVKALSGIEGELLDAVIGRFGFDGSPPRSLPQSVNGAHVGPEWIRQLQVRALQRAPSHPISMPALDRALDLLTRGAPMPAAEAAAALQASGISTIPFDPASVISAARLCGRSVDVEVDTGAGEAFVIRRGVHDGVPRFARDASQRASAFGAASLVSLTEHGAALSERDARDVLVRHCRAQFLDDDWFWLPERRRNRLRTLTRRILSVAPTLDVAAVRAGIFRAYGRRSAAPVPPTHVIAAFYEAHPEFAVDERRRVCCTTPLDWRTELGKNDRIFVEVLRAANQGMLDRWSFHEACVEHGMTSYTFNSAARVSVVLDNPRRGMWRLRMAQ